jgi:uncharacterized protein (TIRG00374 family)
VTASSNQHEPPKAPKKPSKLRKVLLTSLKLGLAIALLGYLFSKGDLDPQTLKQPTSSPLTLVALLGIVVVSISLSGVRWWILLGGEGIEVRLRTAVKLTWIGHFWNMVIPGAVSGDAVKMFYVGQLVPKEQREESWSTVFADRVIGLVALISLSAVAALASMDLIWPRPKLKATFLLMLSILALTAVGAVLLALGVGRTWRVTAWLREKLPFGESLARAYQTLFRLTKRPKRIAAAYGLSPVAHCLSVTNAFLLGRLFTDALQGLQYFALVPIALFSNAVPLTPGGMGIGEKVLSDLFTWAGAGAAPPGELAKAGVSVMVWLRLVFWVAAIAGGVLYALHKREAAPSGEPATQEAPVGAQEVSAEPPPTP